jgi:hypothetical protein
MYVRSLLTLVNISDSISTPSIGVGAEYCHLYADDNQLYLSVPYSETLVERIVGIRPSYIQNHGIVYYDTTGTRNEFNIIPPNNTTIKKLLTSYDDTTNLTFKWVDVNDLITLPDVYWSLDATHGLYPTSITNRVTIGEAASADGAGTALYIKGNQSIKDGLLSTLNSVGNILATYKDNLNTTYLDSKPLVGNYGGYLVTHTDNAKDALLHLNSSGVTLNHLMAYLSPTDLSSADASIITARSMENSFNDTGYGFRRHKSTTISTGDTTWAIDHSLYEIENVTFNKQGIINVTVSNPITNKIYTAKIVSNDNNDGLSLPSNATVLSGEFIANDTNYMQIMCVEDGTYGTVEYLVTYSQDKSMVNKTSYAITDLTDVANDYSTLKDRLLRVNPTGDGIIFSSLLGATLNSTDGYIPSWNGTTGSLLNNGYAVSTDLYTENTNSYLVTADVIKEVIDESKAQVVSTSANVDADTKVILIDKSSGDLTLTFPDLSGSDTRARVWIVKDVSATENNNDLIIATAGTHTVEGETTFTVSGNGFARDVIFVTNYHIA